MVYSTSVTYDADPLRAGVYRYRLTDPGQAVTGGAVLRSRIAAAMPGVPFSFDQAFWSDPLGLVRGALPASPPSAGQGNTTLLQAASMQVFCNEEMELR